MRLGVHFVNFTLPGGPAAIAPTLAATARAAEEGGCAWFTVMDHWFQMEDFGSAEEPMLEGYTSLGFVAGQTRTIDLGLLVTGVTYRHPGLLAKQVDHARRPLGGPRDSRHRGGAGTSASTSGSASRFPPCRSASSGSRRRSRSASRCGATKTAPSRAGTTSWPRRSAPRNRSRSPRPGSSSAAAASGSSCGSSPATPTGATSSRSPAVIGHKIEVLDRHCEAEGRDPASIEKTIIALSDPLADLDAFLAEMDEYARLGVEHVQVMPKGPDPVGVVSRLGEEVVPRLAGIGLA